MISHKQPFIIVPRQYSLVRKCLRCICVLCRLSGQFRKVLAWLSYPGSAGRLEASRQLLGRLGAFAASPPPAP